MPIFLKKTSTQNAGQFWCRSLAASILATLMLSQLISTAKAVSRTSTNETAATYQKRPGPDLLYAPPAKSPQLENSRIWRAKPILISGVSAYRNGEFLYQDFLYDDAGANTQQHPGIFFGRSGGYTYPLAASYAGNAADIVEVRLRLLPDGIAIRVTYNSMIDARLIGTSIALGDSHQPLPIPHKASASEPAKIFVTVHGLDGDIVDAATGTVLPIQPSVFVDIVRRQVEIRVPNSAYDLRKETGLRIAVAAGLWDIENNQFLIPQEKADDRHPGGAGNLKSPPAFFNVAFRYNEPTRSAYFPVATLGAGFREDQQAEVLAGSADLSPFFAQVDLRKLRTKTDDELNGRPEGAPRSGFMDRVVVSHFESAQGRGSSSSLQAKDCASPCAPAYAGQLQPYEIYVPDGAEPKGGWGLVWDLHGAGVNYNEDLGTTRQKEFGNGMKKSIVVSPQARGEAYWFYGEALADFFEVWADVARLYHIDPDHVVISGASMGGFGTLKIAAMFPDLFAAAAPHIPCPSAGTGYNGTNEPGGSGSFLEPLLASLRNVPLSIWTGEVDKTCSYSQPKGQLAMRDELESLGYRYDFRTFKGMAHVLLPSYKDQIVFLKDDARITNPFHISFVLNETMNERKFGILSDHAYWLSDLKSRDKENPQGTIDAISYGFGEIDGQTTPSRSYTGTFSWTEGSRQPGSFEYNGFVRQQYQRTQTQKRNELEIHAVNISEVTIDRSRARIGCDARLKVQTDGPLVIRLTGCREQRIFNADVK